MVRYNYNNAVLVGRQFSEEEQEEYEMETHGEEESNVVVIVIASITNVIYKGHT